MNRKLLWLFVGCVLAWPQTGAAQIQTIRKEVRQIFGGSQSPDNARIAAITRAKREALEEAGTYLESLTIVRDHQVAKDEILALSSGVLKVTVIEEEPFVEGEAFGIRVVAEVQVDLSVLEERVHQLLGDREHLARLREAERRVQELLKQLEALEIENTRLADALSTTEQRETLSATFSENTANLNAQEHIRQGLAFYNGLTFDPPDSAVFHFTKAIELDSKNDLAYALRARGLVVLYSINENEDLLAQAINDANMAIQINPSQPFAYFARGNAYLYLDQAQRAIKDYDQALRLEPTSAHVYFNRALAYRRLGQSHRAIDEFNRAIELDSSDVYFYIQRGRTYRLLGQVEQAIEDYEQSIRIDASNPHPYILRGSAYVSLEQNQRAISDLNLAIDLDPSNPFAYIRRGDIYIYSGQYQRAIADFNFALGELVESEKVYRKFMLTGGFWLSRRLGNVPLDAYVHRRRGSAYWLSGQDVLATADWRKACQLGDRVACRALWRPWIIRAGLAGSALVIYFLLRG
ncbi:MAG: tetratricopeptide repeat protein [Candidatus Marinimicrobia bacterium]|nr:tetratricopeptide repeat protein [Candidatus Neomarinimicrobiota bacterium]